MPQSWTRALDHLLDAALLGSASAIGQLGVLSGKGPADGDANWCRELRRRADLTAWTTPPVKRTLRDSPRTVAVDGFLPAGASLWLTGLVAGRLTPARVYGGGGPLTSSHRGNSAFEFQFPDCDLVVLLTRRRIADTIGLPVAALEASQVLHYNVGESFALHHDYLDPAAPGAAREIAANGQRIVTFLIYLNDDFDGGETHFPALGLSHRAQLGDALYFGNLHPIGQPDPRTLHAGLPPTRGEKWLFSQWIRNRAMM
jgi:prolyl 4-hydroxylase